MKVSFVVNGKPIGKQRPRTVHNKYTGKTLTYTPDKTKAYENEVAKAYRRKSSDTFKNAVSVNIIVFVKQPKKLTYSNPTVKPDIDNIAKTILDGLNGIAYSDDKQVVKLSIVKCYGNEDYISVSISDYELSKVQ